MCHSAVFHPRLGLGLGLNFRVRLGLGLGLPVFFFLWINILTYDSLTHYNFNLNVDMR